MGTALLRKIPEGQVKDNVQAFEEIPSWIQGNLNMPYELYLQQEDCTDVYPIL